MRYYWYKLLRFLNEGAIPFTKVILILSGLSFITAALLGVFNWINLNELLMLTPEYSLRLFWTFLTYPLANSDFNIFTLILSGLWLWFVGGSLERTWGTRSFGVFFILVTLVTGGAMALATILTDVPGFSIYGLWLPLVGVTWAWAKVYPEREVLIWGVFPVKARWLAWIDAGLTFFGYFGVKPLIAVASISGIIIVYLFGATGPLGRGIHYRNRRREDRFRNQRKPGRNRLRIIK